MRVLSGVYLFSPLSMRDQFILKRAQAFWDRAFPGSRHTRCLWKWLRNPKLPRATPWNDDPGGSRAKNRTQLSRVTFADSAGLKHASTPPPKAKGKKSRGGGNS